jgi:ribosomal protein L37AE/L43A
METDTRTEKLCWCHICKRLSIFFRMPTGSIWYCMACRHAEGTTEE